MFSVFGVRTGSAAENGTFHNCAPGTALISFRQNRSKSSAPEAVARATAVTRSCLGRVRIVPPDILEGRGS